MSASQPATWLVRFSAWLTPRRLRAQAIVLAICLCSVCAVDLSVSGPFDRAENLKFQDFLPFYASARLIDQHRAADLYEPQIVTREVQTIAPNSGPVSLPYLYGPQVALIFTPLSRFSFFTAAWIWVGLSLCAYFACVYLIWKRCPNLQSFRQTVFISALAFPPLFHFFLRGQISVLLLICFTAAWLAFRVRRNFLAGLALGLLVFKPQFLVAIPVVLLLAGAWDVLAGTCLSAIAQLAATCTIFGSTVMRSYLNALWNVSNTLAAVEPGTLSPIQMHSLRAFWTLLIPWPQAAWTLYLLSSVGMVLIAAAVWKSSTSASLRFCALTLAAVLLNPHLFVYDLLVLAPVLLVLAERIADAKQSYSAHRDSLVVFTYLAFILPLLGPLSRWTHVQLSVLAFVGLLWILWRETVPA